MGDGTLPVVIDDPTPSSDWQLLGNSQASLCAWLMKDRWSFSPPRTIPFRLYLQHFMCILIVLKEAEYGIYFQAKILLYEVRFLTIFFCIKTGSDCSVFILSDNEDNFHELEGALVLVWQCRFLCTCLGGLPALPEQCSRG